VRRTAWTVLALLALSLPLVAAEAPLVRRGIPKRQGRVWVEYDQCAVPVRPGGRLIFRAQMGSVTVFPGATPQLQCSLKLVAYTSSESDARTSFAGSELGARRLGSDGAYIDFRNRYQDEPLRRVDASFTIVVPLHYNLDLETQSGGIQVCGLDGELRAATAGGDIRAGDLSGPVRLQTAAGSITLGNIDQRLEAHTAGGSIHVGDVKGDAYLETHGGDIVAGTITGMVRALTAAGNIIMRSATGPVVVQTAGGQIRLGECGGPVRAHTAAGSIQLDGARGRVEAQTAGGNLDLLRLMSGVRAQTAAGNVLVQIDANRQSFTPSSLESSVGDVEVFLPSDLPLNVNALIDTAAGHTISSDFPIMMRRDGGDWGVGPVQGSAVLSGGGAPLVLRTALGNIEIRKLNSGSTARLKAYQQAFWRNWQEQIKEQQQNIDRMQKLMQDEQERLQELQKSWPEDDNQ
jgi:DUF4097 and DUF4098 domain-containing protein YvlB